VRTPRAIASAASDADKVPRNLSGARVATGMVDRLAG
jgi:hypothetical protein